VRKHVPTDLLTVIVKREIWRSLKTDSYRIAVRRSHFVISQIEAEFEATRQQVGGMTVDETLISPMWDGRVPLRPQLRTKSRPPTGPISDATDDLTFGEVYRRFMSDPTRDWSARTRLSYETTRRLALSIIGADTPMSDISRATCREFMEALRFVPKNTSKKYRGLSPREAADRARREGWTDLISASNANTYLNKVCVVLNWAVQEEFLAKNHMRGLRLADPVARGKNLAKMCLDWRKADPDIAIASNRVANLPGTMTHAAARGSNSLIGRDILQTMTFVTPDEFEKLEALNAWTGLDCLVRHRHIDEFNQTAGRNLGFRKRGDVRHHLLVNKALFELLAGAPKARARYEMQVVPNRSQRLKGRNRKVVAAVPSSASRLSALRVRLNQDREAEMREPGMAMAA